MQGNYLVCFLDDIYTKAERTLIEAGKFSSVHQARHDFQEAMEPRFVDAVEEHTGRRVEAFLSQWTRTSPSRPSGSRRTGVRKLPREPC